MSESPKPQNHPGHALPWKAVVAFNPALGWPVLHTLAEDLSATGAVITSDYGNLTGAQITLILDLPPGVDAQTTVDASVQLTAKFDSGKIQLNTTHIAGFGALQRMVAPGAISDASLNELSGFILGEVRDLKLLLLHGG